MSGGFFMLLSWLKLFSAMASTDEILRVMVWTQAKGPPSPFIWYRVPCDYRKIPGRWWRTLAIFGDATAAARPDAAGLAERQTDLWKLELKI